MEMPPSGPGLGSLPEELLQRVLALVPLDWDWPLNEESGVPGLLALRLVCRRWARALLSPAVWRHRALSFTSYSGMLHLVPCAGRLSLCTRNSDTSPLRALVDSSCRVRSLSIEAPASAAVSDLFRRILAAQRPGLEELELRVKFINWQNNATRLLEQVDAAEGLRALRLEALDGPWYHHHGPLDFPFRRLSSLTRLSLGDNLHPDTVRALLEANKASLREVDLGTNDCAAVLAVTATLVRVVEVVGSGMSASLAHLRQLQHLDVLKARPEVGAQLRFLEKLLDSSPLVPRELDLCLASVGFGELCRWNNTLGLRRVSTLRVVLAGIVCEDDTLLALALPDVVALHVDVWSTGFAWNQFTAAFVDVTAPKLRELHLREFGIVSAPVSEWAALMTAKRPTLSIFVSVLQA